MIFVLHLTHVRAGRAWCGLFISITKTVCASRRRGRRNASPSRILGFGNRSRYVCILVFRMKSQVGGCLRSRRIFLLVVFRSATNAWPRYFAVSLTGTGLTIGAPALWHRVKFTYASSPLITIITHRLRTVTTNFTTAASTSIVNRVIQRPNRIKFGIREFLRTYHCWHAT